MSLLRFQNLYDVYTQQAEAQRHPKSSDDGPEVSESEISKALSSLNLALSGPKFAWESSTPFGKLNITDVTVSNVGASLKHLATNASYQIEACKESLGIKTFRKEEADSLINCGILGGDQWKISPATGQLIRHQPSASALSGSLTFTAPTETFELILQSSAFKALMALTIIGGLLGPVERTIDLIASGALDGICEDQSDLGRPYIEKALKRAMLRSYTASRSSKHGDAFEDFVLKCLEFIPDSLRQRCAASKDDVRTYGIDDSQLGSIAEWAFAGLKYRTLVLFNRVEALAAAVVSTFFKARALALVDCEAKSYNLLNENVGLSSVPALAVYYGGTAQQAINILHKMNWLQPVTQAESKRISSSSPHLPLSCSVEAALKVCPAFLQSVGVLESDATYLVDAIKKDAIAQFARKISIVGEDQMSWSYTSQENVVYSYQYGEHLSGYDWKYWIGLENIQSDRIMLNRPVGHRVELGTLTFYGYAAKAIDDRPSVRGLHDQHIRQLPHVAVTQKSDVSIALGAVAGLIYGLALTCVHCHDATQMKALNISRDLDSDLSDAYSNLVAPLDNKIRVPRSKCLGVLSQIWLGMAGLYIPHWPATALGISNSRGAVMSAVFAETKSLEEATTKLIVSADVPDIMIGDKPVVACAVTPSSKVQKRGHAADVKISKKEPYDGCWQTYCITITGNVPPALDKDNLLANVVSVVPVCGYVACGAIWWENVDFDNAFAVMADSWSSSTESACSNCPLEIEARWLEQEVFLQRAQDGGFSCSLPQSGQKLVIPAYGNGMMQSFLCGVFRWSTGKLRYPLSKCIEHCDADIVIS